MPGPAGMAQQDYLWARVGLVGWADGVVERCPGGLRCLARRAGRTVGMATVTGVPKPNNSVAEVTCATGLDDPLSAKENEATNRRTRPCASRYDVEGDLRGDERVGGVGQGLLVGGRSPAPVRAGGAPPAPGRACPGSAPPGRRGRRPGRLPARRAATPPSIANTSAGSVAPPEIRLPSEAFAVAVWLQLRGRDGGRGRRSQQWRRAAPTPCSASAPRSACRSAPSDRAEPTCLPKSNRPEPCMVSVCGGFAASCPARGSPGWRR